jgi:hypothetical protein
MENRLIEPDIILSFNTITNKQGPSTTAVSLHSLYAFYMHRAIHNRRLRSSTIKMYRLRRILGLTMPSRTYYMHAVCVMLYCVCVCVCACARALTMGAYARMCVCMCVCMCVKRCVCACVGNIAIRNSIFFISPSN